MSALPSIADMPARQADIDRAVPGNAGRRWRGWRFCAGELFVLRVRSDHSDQSLAQFCSQGLLAFAQPKAVEKPNRRQHKGNKAGALDTPSHCSD